MTRAAFLIDGFNLYHSLLSATVALDGAGTRWLDIRSFCESFLSGIGGGARLESVAYFSSPARHLEAHRPQSMDRQAKYVDCLRDTGVRVEMAHFRKKPLRCPRCAGRIIQHEEKQTDVAIAAMLFELFQRDCCDVAVLVTGDSDLVPAVRTAIRLFPGKRVHSCFPYNRVSDELRQVASGHFKVSATHYLKHQLPDPFMTRAGQLIAKPEGW